MGCFTAENCRFLDLNKLQLVTHMERWQVMFWNRYVVHKVLSSLKSGNFSWKPTWHVHTTWAALTSLPLKWRIVFTELPVKLNIVTWPSEWRKRRPVYYTLHLWIEQTCHRFQQKLIFMSMNIMNILTFVNGFCICWITIFWGSHFVSHLWWILWLLYPENL